MALKLLFSDLTWMADTLLWAWLIKNQKVISARFKDIEVNLDGIQK